MDAAADAAVATQVGSALSQVFRSEMRHSAKGLSALRAIMGQDPQEAVMELFVQLRNQSLLEVWEAFASTGKSGGSEATIKAADNGKIEFMLLIATLALVPHGGSYRHIIEPNIAKLAREIGARLIKSVVGLLTSSRQHDRLVSVLIFLGSLSRIDADIAREVLAQLDTCSDQLAPIFLSIHRIPEGGKRSRSGCDSQEENQIEILLSSDFCGHAISPQHISRRLGVVFFVLSFIGSKDITLVRMAAQQKILLTGLINPISSDPVQIQKPILKTVRTAITGESSGIPPRLQGSIFGRKSLDSLAKILAAEETEHESAESTPFNCSLSYTGQILLDVCVDPTKGICPLPSSSFFKEESSGNQRLVHFLSKSLQPSQYFSHQQLLFTVLDFCPGITSAYLRNTSLNLGISANRNEEASDKATGIANTARWVVNANFVSKCLRRARYAIDGIKDSWLHYHSVPKEESDVFKIVEASIIPPCLQNQSLGKFLYSPSSLVQFAGVNLLYAVLENLKSLADSVQALIQLSLDKPLALPTSVRDWSDFLRTITRKVRTFFPEPRLLLGAYRQIEGKRRCLFLRSKIISVISLYIQCVPEALEDNSIDCFKLFDLVTRGKERECKSEHPVLILSAIRLVESTLESQPYTFIQHLKTNILGFLSTTCTLLETFKMSDKGIYRQLRGLGVKVIANKHCYICEWLEALRWISSISDFPRKCGDDGGVADQDSSQEAVKFLSSCISAILRNPVRFRQSRAAIVSPLLQQLLGDLPKLQRSSKRSEAQKRLPALIVCLTVQRLLADSCVTMNRENLLQFIDESVSLLDVSELQQQLPAQSNWGLLYQLRQHLLSARGGGAYTGQETLADKLEGRLAPVPMPNASEHVSNTDLVSIVSDPKRLSNFDATELTLEIEARAALQNDFQKSTSSNSILSDALCERSGDSVQANKKSSSIWQRLSLLALLRISSACPKLCASSKWKILLLSKIRQQDEVVDVAGAMLLPLLTPCVEEFKALVLNLLVAVLTEEDLEKDPESASPALLRHRLWALCVHSWIFQEKIVNHVASTSVLDKASILRKLLFELLDKIQSARAFAYPNSIPRNMSVKLEALLRQVVKEGNDSRKDTLLNYITRSSVLRFLHPEERISLLDAILKEYFSCAEELQEQWVACCQHISFQHDIPDHAVANSEISIRGTLSIFQSTAIRKQAENTISSKGFWRAAELLCTAVCRLQSRGYFAYFRPEFVIAMNAQLESSHRKDVSQDFLTEIQRCFDADPIMITVFFSNLRLCLIAKTVEFSMDGLLILIDIISALVRDASWKNDSVIEATLGVYFDALEYVEDHSRIDVWIVALCSESISILKIACLTSQHACKAYSTISRLFPGAPKDLLAGVTFDSIGSFLSSIAQDEGRGGATDVVQSQKLSHCLVGVVVDRLFAMRQDLEPFGPGCDIDKYLQGLACLISIINSERCRENLADMDTWNKVVAVIVGFGTYFVKLKLAEGLLLLHQTLDNINRFKKSWPLEAISSLVHEGLQLYTDAEMQKVLISFTYQSKPYEDSTLSEKISSACRSKTLSISLVSQVIFDKKDRISSKQDLLGEDLSPFILLIAFLSLGTGCSLRNDVAVGLRILLAKATAQCNGTLSYNDIIVRELTFILLERREIREETYIQLGLPVTESSRHALRLKIGKGDIAWKDLENHGLSLLKQATTVPFDSHKLMYTCGALPSIWASSSRQADTMLLSGEFSFFRLLVDSRLVEDDLRKSVLDPWCILKWATFHTAEREGDYDMSRFGTDMTNLTRNIARSGVLAVGIICLSSPEMSVRKLAYSFLSQISSLIFQYKDVTESQSTLAKFKEAPQLHLLILYIRNSITTPLQKVPCVFSLFWAELSLIIMQPASSLYTIGNTYLLRNPVETYQTVPLTQDLFSSDFAEMRHHHQTILQLLNLAVMTEEDIEPVKKMFLPEIISASLASSFPDALSRKFSLQLIQNMAQIPKIGRDMHANMGLTNFIYTHAIRGYYCNLLLPDEAFHRERMEKAMAIIISIVDSFIKESERMSLTAPSSDSGESRIEQYTLASVQQFASTIVYDMCTSNIEEQRLAHAIPLMKRLFRKMLNLKARSGKNREDIQNEAGGERQTSVDSYALPSALALRIMDLLDHCCPSNGDECSNPFLDILLLVEIKPPVSPGGAQSFLKAISRIWEQSLSFPHELWLVAELHSWTIRHLRQWSYVRCRVCHDEAREAGKIARITRVSTRMTETNRNEIRALLAMKIARCPPTEYKLHRLSIPILETIRLCYRHLSQDDKLLRIVQIQSILATALDIFWEDRSQEDMIQAISILGRWNKGWRLIESLSTVWEVKGNLQQH